MSLTRIEYRGVGTWGLALALVAALVAGCTTASAPTSGTASQPASQAVTPIAPQAGADTVKAAESATEAAAAGASHAASAGAPQAASVAASLARGEYLLGTGDKIRLTVFGEDSISGEYEVDAGGQVSLPLVGPIVAAGLTPEAFADSVAEAYRSGGYLRSPKVSAEVLNYRPFYILGEVSKPGEYPYRNGLNVISAVAAAGGFTYRANTKSVRIQRAGQVETKKYPATTLVPVLPGDVVTVTERWF